MHDLWNSQPIVISEKSVYDPLDVDIHTDKKKVKILPQQISGVLKFSQNGLIQKYSCERT